jgi:hypothetical protein
MDNHALSHNLDNICHWDHPGSDRSKGSTASQVSEDWNGYMIFKRSKKQENIGNDPNEILNVKRG